VGGWFSGADVSIQHSDEHLVLIALQVQELMDASLLEAQKLLREPARTAQLDWRGKYVLARLVLDRAALTASAAPLGAAVEPPQLEAAAAAATVSTPALTADAAAGAAAGTQQQQGAPTVAAPATGASELLAPLSMLFPKQHASFRVTRKALQDAAATVSRLGRQHFPRGPAPGLEHPDLRQGLEQYVMSTICNGEQELLKLLARAHAEELLLQKMTGHAAAQRKVKASKVALNKRAAELHEQLVLWVAWALRLQEAKVVTWASMFQPRLQLLKDSKLEAMRKSSWGDSLAGAVAETHIQQAAVRVYLLRRKQLALQAELQLLRGERQQLVEVLQQRVAALQQHLGQGEWPAGRPTSERFLYLMELQRNSRVLSVARRLQAAASGSQEEAAAAAEAICAQGAHTQVGDDAA
jgi:hypothetical protein